MDDLAVIYSELKDLQKAEFYKIDHEDTMIAQVYLVTKTSKDPLILKVHSRKEDFDREVYFLNYLKKTLPVPRILEVVKPKQDISGAILMEYIEGTLVHGSDWTEALAYDIGLQLAKLHLNRTAGYGDCTKPEDLTNDPIIYFNQKFNEELIEYPSHLPSDLIDRCRGYLESYRKQLYIVDGPCMVHRDFRPGNMIVFRGELKRIIDWASARSGFA